MVKIRLAVSHTRVLGPWDVAVSNTSNYLAVKVTLDDEEVRC